MKDITFNDIKLFLNYPDEFWDYIDSKIKRVDSTISGNEIFYATLLKFDNIGRVIDMKVMVPYIIDIKTACINVHEFKHAYDMYRLLNKYVDENDSKYEEEAIKLEEKFQNKLYVKK